MVQGLKHVRSTQLRLFNCGLGLEEPIDDIAINIDYIRSLLGKEVAMAQEKRARTTVGFVVDVQEAVSLEILDVVPM